MDRAERLIRQARPADPRKLSDRAEADLARMLAAAENAPSIPGTTRPSAGHGVHWLWSVAAVVVLAVVIAGVSFIHPGSAFAATPPMLVLNPISGDAASALRGLQKVAASQPDASAQTQIVTQWWGLASEVDASGSIRASHVDPRRRVAQLGPLGFSGYTDYAAQPYDAQGNSVEDPSLPAPGTRLSTVEVDADQQVFRDPPPSDAGQVGSYLSDALGEFSDSPTMNAIDGITALLAERVLSPAQHAAIAGYLATLEDVELLGSGADRLQRSVLVFAAPTQDEQQSLLLLSRDTGQVIATETIYRGTQRTDIPSPAVVGYTAWETS